MDDDPAFTDPIHPDHAHRAEDPFGYSITHQRDVDDNIVALVLVRLSDREEVGRYPSRDALDAAVEAQTAMSSRPESGLDAATPSRDGNEARCTR